MYGQVEELEAGFVKMIRWNEKVVLCKLDEAEGYIRGRPKWRENKRVFLVV